jgi:hypothetical protein
LTNGQLLAGASGAAASGSKLVEREQLKLQLAQPIWPIS